MFGIEGNINVLLLEASAPHFPLWKHKETEFTDMNSAENTFSQVPHHQLDFEHPTQTSSRFISPRHRFGIAAVAIVFGILHQARPHLNQLPYESVGLVCPFPGVTDPDSGGCFISQISRAIGVSFYPKSGRPT